LCCDPPPRFRNGDIDAKESPLKSQQNIARDPFFDRASPPPNGQAFCAPSQLGDGYDAQTEFVFIDGGEPSH